MAAEWLLYYSPDWDVQGLICSHGMYTISIGLANAGVSTHSYIAGDWLTHLFIAIYPSIRPYIYRERASNNPANSNYSLVTYTAACPLQATLSHFQAPPSWRPDWHSLWSGEEHSPLSPPHWRFLVRATTEGRREIWTL